MGRPVGLGKTGGRKAGTPNRNTQAVIERLDNLGCDPIEGLARIALDPATTTDLKVRCLAELAQYAYPKRKAVAVAVDDERSWHVTIEHIGQPQTSRARDSIV